MSPTRPTRPAASRAVPFLVTDDNRMAWTAIHSLVSAIEHGERPVSRMFIHGPAGAGKSHLCEVLQVELRRRRTEARCTHLSAADLAELFSRDAPESSDADAAGDDSAAREDDVSASHQSVAGITMSSLYQSAIVVIEDLQYLARRPAAQRSLAWLLDELVRTGTSVVMTAISAPGSLSGLLPRLTNRLRGGLSLTVALPDAAAREKLLAHFCSHLQIAIPIGVLRLFSRELAVSPRELLGTLLRFDDLARQTRRPADTTLARQFLKREVAPHPIVIEDIGGAVAREFGVRVADMRSKARDQALALPRQCTMFLARELTGQHLSRIGAWFSGRSHSTVLHSCERVRGMLEDDPALRQRFERIRVAIKTRTARRVSSETAPN